MKSPNHLMHLSMIEPDSRLVDWLRTAGAKLNWKLTFSRQKKWQYIRKVSVTLSTSRCRRVNCQWTWCPTTCSGDHRLTWTKISVGSVCLSWHSWTIFGPRDIFGSRATLDLPISKYSTKFILVTWDPQKLKPTLTFFHSNFHHLILFIMTHWLCFTSLMTHTLVRL